MRDSSLVGEEPVIYVTLLKRDKYKSDRELYLHCVPGWFLCRSKAEAMINDLLSQSSILEDVPVTDGDPKPPEIWVSKRDPSKHVYEKIQYEQLPFQKDRAASVGTLEFNEKELLKPCLGVKSESAGSLPSSDKNTNIYEEINDLKIKTERSGSTSSSSSGKRTPYEGISDGEVEEENKKKRKSRSTSLRRRLSHRLEKATSPRQRTASRRTMSDRRSTPDLDGWVRIPSPPSTLRTSDKPSITDSKEMEIPLGDSKSLIRGFLDKLARKPSDSAANRKQHMPKRKCYF